jgi:hypothetical protein
MEVTSLRVITATQGHLSGVGGALRLFWTLRESENSERFYRE